MDGLAIISFLWPNHVAMARFPRETLPVTGRAAISTLASDSTFD